MSTEREELIFIKSYLSHQDQDADHGFIVRRINDVLAGRDPSPETTAALAEMHGEATPMPSEALGEGDLLWLLKGLVARSVSIEEAFAKLRPATDGPSPAVAAGWVEDFSYRHALSEDATIELHDLVDEAAPSSGSAQDERVATPGANETALISVEWWRPGFHIELPRIAVTRKVGATGVTLTRDEAFDLLDKLRRCLAIDTPEGKSEPFTREAGGSDE